MGNSVIYRPAYDAEVEYLESTGTQYIDTGIVFNSPYTIELSFMLTKLNNYNSLIFGAWHDNDSTDRLQFYVANNNRFNNDGHSNITCVQPSVIPDTNTIYNITYTPTISQPNANSSMWLFARNNDRSTYLPYNGLRVYSCKIKDIDSDTVIRDFIPVRIGSVGYLYDKVTKQLFANKGTGNFVLGNDASNAVIPQQRCVLYFGNQRSVGFERIYEEYEWLCGRNGAYINTLHKLVPCDDVFECHFKWNGEVTNPNGKTQGVFGCYFYQGANCWTRVAIAYDLFYVNYFKLVNWNTIPINGVNDVEIKSLISSSDSGNYSFTLNGVTHEYSNNGLVNTETNADVLLFENITNNGTYFHGDIAYFKITDTSSNIKMNLIPCKLLQSIPAILDGNGIARQAGECGMWDKVSNKFYGNVANSGTFTVKGPKCYEEYNWLEVGMPPNCYSCNLPINSENFSYSRKYTQIGNTAHLTASNNYAYFSGDLTGVGIWNGSQTINFRSMSITNLEITCTSDKLLINSVEFPKYGTPVILPFYNVSGSATTLCKQSKVIIDNAVHYVPCKLTHGIPASMDANGISRPAGTCGMWDKVNDKFYGNVASSGSFTVSND